MSAEDTKPKMLFVCNDGWAHDIQDSRGSQQCKKCNGWLDELVDQYAQEKCLEELKMVLGSEEEYIDMTTYIESRITSLSTKEDK